MGKVDLHKLTKIVMLCPALPVKISNRDGDEEEKLRTAALMLSRKQN